MRFPLQIPKSVTRKRRIAEKQTRHAVAILWWDPESLPNWLNEDTYRERIQPRLKGFTVVKLADVLAESKPYAALIRSGKNKSTSETLAEDD